MNTPYHVPSLGIVGTTPSKPLYQIRKNGKLVLQFRGTYDQVRGEVRKLIRVDRKNGRKTGNTGFFDGISRNPSRLGNYRIKRVEG